MGGAWASMPPVADRVPASDAKQVLMDFDDSADKLTFAIFSDLTGGERKRNEVLQLAVLEPELAVLDETDSGLDIDALRTVAEGVKKVATADRGFLIITHYQRMLDYITPDIVHVFLDGRIVASGGPDLADQIEDAGYDHYRSGATAN